MRKSLESDLMRKVSQRLSVYQMTKEVIWYARLQSLAVKTVYGGRIRGCPAGTPDWVALIRNKQDGITALFVECKSLKGKLNPKQEEFYKKYLSTPNVYILICREIIDLNNMIALLAKDFVSTLEM